MANTFKKILIVFGTRPEAIKMAPLYFELRKSFIVKLCITAQHREMLDQVLSIFNLHPDFDLDIMTSGQDLFDVTTQVLSGLKKVLLKENPDLVLVHGDTTTTFAASLASFYSGVPVGHIEAGLRTNNIFSPFPEELNRQATSRIASFHFSPTKAAQNNLLKENIPSHSIYVTGNTVIDALSTVIKTARKLEFPHDLRSKLPFLTNSKKNPKIILVTSHRRENFGEGIEQISKALAEIASLHPSVHIIYPVHLNPNIIKPVKKLIGGIANIYLIKPLEYVAFIKLMDISTLILTDSGGIQEEAPSLGIPVLVMRNTTERFEAVEQGLVKLVGVNKKSIVDITHQLLTDSNAYKSMIGVKNPYGDGHASERIHKILKKVLK